MKAFQILFIILFTTCVQAQVQKRVYYQDPNLAPLAHPLDFTHLDLEVSFVPEEGKVMGKVVHDFKVLNHTADTVWLDGPGIELKSALLDGKEVKYTTETTGFIFRFGQILEHGTSHKLELTYECFPEKGIYFIGWNDSTDRCRKQIWTQGQGQDNRYWIPMYDMPNDKVTTDIKVNFNNKYKVLSNGLLMAEKKNKNGTTDWHYRLKHPHATYLIMLGIGDYAVKTTKSPSGVPMHFWYYPDWENRVEPTFRHSEDMMRFMEEETGTPYPWNSYSQIMVQEFLYGAMENTTATVFGDFYSTDERGFIDRNYVRVNAHELAHQWFGDDVTARSAAHHWLQESFATHYDLKYQGVAFGQDYFDWTRRQATNQALAASAADLKPIAHSEAGSVRHYPKGSYVLEMLRDVAGNENFKRTMQYYLKKHSYRNVDSEDLLVAFHEATGLSLDWFWEEWIYKGGEPHYKVGFETFRRKGKTIGRFEVEQVHQLSDLTSLFKMPISFLVALSNGQQLEKVVMIEEVHHEVNFDIPDGAEVSYVLFDTGSRVMKRVDFPKDYEMLLAQAKNAKNMLDRYDAVVAMEATPIKSKRDDLHALFAKKDFHAVRSAVLRQLINDLESKEVMRAALKDEDAEVRKAVLRMSAVIFPDMLADYEALLTDSSYEIVEWSLEMLCAQYPSNAQKYLDQTAGIVGVHEMNVRIKWLEIQYALSGKEEHLKTLKDLVTPSFEFRTRMAAARSLKKLNILDEEIIASLFEALFSFNPRLRGPAKDILNYYAEQAEHRKLIKWVVKKGSWTSEEQRVINLLSLH